MDKEHHPEAPRQTWQDKRKNYNDQNLIDIDKFWEAELNRLKADLEPNAGSEELEALEKCCKFEANRQKAEMETNRDLSKDVEQLLCDVHEETLLGGRTETQNLMHAQKRMVSMMARVSISNEKLSRLLILLSVLMLVTSGFNIVVVLLDVISDWMISLGYLLIGSIITFIVMFVWKLL